MKVYISGLYCGTNPQPGVGIARSIRSGYPDAVIVGVEYSNRCSGIHWQDFDEIWLQRPWEELSLPKLAEEIKNILDSGAIWISGIDLEIMWFSEIFPEGHPNLLAPSLSALKRTAKPGIPAHEGLSVKIPEFVSTDVSDWDLHSFCRRNDWKIWLKGPYYDAVKARNWAQFEEVRAALARSWSTEKLFVQTHITGYEQSISLCAYKGKLLGCVEMQKRDLTDLNKTWAGNVSEVNEGFKTKLEEITRELNWTGGAELEMICDADGQLWMLEWNPRFPAWIHGATITGHNLPAQLMEGATGVRAENPVSTGEEFTRVVLEVPVRQEFPLPPLPEPLGGTILGHSLKHPSGLLGFAHRIHAPNIGGYIKTGKSVFGQKTENNLPPVPTSLVEDISAFDFERMQTPSELFLEKTAGELFGRAAEITEKLSSEDVQVINAYSVKTNPDARFLQLARRAGFLAETISSLEASKALEVGFKSQQIILNGPGKWWRQEYLPDAPLHAIFCDSVADLERTIEAIQTGNIKTGIVGVRLRTPAITSRFGIPVDSPEMFQGLLNAIRKLPRECSFGIHFHMASSNVGIKQWQNLFESVLRWCASIEALAGRRIECLDVGGGWFPDDWQENFEGHFMSAVEKTKEFLPHITQIISEPGKALAQPSMALAMRILEYDCRKESLEAVVDGSIAEIPMHFYYPHRILHQDNRTGEWKALGRGRTNLFGRLCMENDIVAANVQMPENARPGDLLVFCDAGAYDRSMSYVFGRG